MEIGPEVYRTLTRITVVLLTIGILGLAALMLVIWPNDRLRRAACWREMAFGVVMVNTCLGYFFGIGTQETPLRSVTFGLAALLAFWLLLVSWWEWGREIGGHWRRERARRRRRRDGGYR